MTQHPAGYDDLNAQLDKLAAAGLLHTIDRLIDNMRRELGVTSIVVTHDLHSALAIGSRIAMLHEGRIVEISTPEEFIRSSNQVVQDFLEAQYITKQGSWEKAVPS